MSILANLKDKTRLKKNVQRVGRGQGSGRGKTSCRGQKGQGSRSGARRRYGYEGGQFRLFMKLPTRGFTRGRFEKDKFAINFDQINAIFAEGEVVSIASLKEKGILSSTSKAKLKILSRGELKTAISAIEAHTYSENAKEQLTQKNISFKEVK